MAGKRSKITVSLDEDTAALLENLHEELGMPRSRVICEALAFYGENRTLLQDMEQARFYMHMLSGMEHLIIDIDHWQLFLKLVENLDDPELFWEEHRKIARSHGEQLQGTTPREVLERLERCNLYTLREVSDEEFALIMTSDAAKRFVRTFLEEVFEAIGQRADISEELAKVRVKLTVL